MILNIIKNIIPVILTGASIYSCAGSSTITAIKRDDGLIHMISHEGNFTTLMPDKPHRSVKKSPSRMGELSNYIYSCYMDRGSGDSFFYLISFVDYPASLLQSMSGELLIKSTMIGSMKRFKNARLIEEKKLSIENNPGYETIFTGVQKNTGKLVIAKERIYLVNNRMYILLMLTEAFNKHTIADKFMDSFKLTTNI